MLTYIIRRLLLMIPTLIGVTLLVFIIMAKAPGGFESALEDGNQSMGGEARRLKQEFINRYALDKPIYVQYGRWLNQVSPIGFKMTGDYPWTDAEKQAISETLAERDWAPAGSERATTRDLILTISAYSGESRDTVLDLFDQAGADPFKAGPKLFELLETKPLEDGFWDKLEQTQDTDTKQASNALFRELSFSATNKSRIRFNALKFWQIDLGTDKNSRDVGDLLVERLPITLIMNLISVPLIYIVSIIAGVLAARRRGGVFDTVSGSVMLGLYSVPAILAGTLMIAFLASEEYVRWFPASGVHDLQADKMPFLPHAQNGQWHRGWLLDYAWHLVLPVTCLTYTGFAFLTKVMRGSVLEMISADFVRTARAKGVSEQHILFRHVLRNSMLPLITMAASILPAMFVGSFVVEYIFSIQGMGRLTIEAAQNKEVNTVMATTLVGSVLTLLSLLLRDVCYAIADPRVTYD